MNKYKSVTLCKVGSVFIVDDLNNSVSGLEQNLKDTFFKKMQFKTNDNDYSYLISSYGIEDENKQLKKILLGLDSGSLIVCTIQSNA
jgi:hypothetical protein